MNDSTGHVFIALAVVFFLGAAVAGKDAAGILFLEHFGVMMGFLFYKAITAKE